MMRAKLGTLLSALVATAALLAACSRPTAPAGPVVVEFDGITAEVVTSRAFSGTFACPEGDVRVRVEVGTTVAGDDFVLVRPASDWNGDLVVFAHGYRDPALPAGFWDDLPTDLGQLLAALGDLERGDRSGGVGQALALAVCPVSFPVLLDLEDKTPSAFAASSYSANGYAVEVGVPQTHVVNALFAESFGAPDRRFISGASLGGIVALKIAETYGDRYAGALPTCGPVGGSLVQFDYIGHVEAVFRHFYPGVLPGTLETPAGIPFGDPAAPGDPDDEPTVVNLVVAAVNDAPEGLQDMARVRVSPLAGADRRLMQFETEDQILEGLLLALYYATTGKDDVLDEGLPFDNRSTVYSLDATEIEPPRTNGPIAPDTLAYFLAHYEPTGAPGLPTITVHNRYDPVVPSFHEEVYAQLVSDPDPGLSDGLVTTIVPIDGFPTSTPAFGHCAFAEEIVVAFAALGEWAAGDPPALLTSLSTTGTLTP